MRLKADPPVRMLMMNPSGACVPEVSVAVEPPVGCKGSQLVRNGTLAAPVETTSVSGLCKSAGLGRGLSSRLRLLCAPVWVWAAAVFFAVVALCLYRLYPAD